MIVVLLTIGLWIAPRWWALFSMLMNFVSIIHHVQTVVTMLLVCWSHHEVPFVVSHFAYQSWIIWREKKPLKCWDILGCGNDILIYCYISNRITKCILIITQAKGQGPFSKGPSKVTNHVFIFSLRWSLWTVPAVLTVIDFPQAGDDLSWTLPYWKFKRFHVFDAFNNFSEIRTWEEQVLLKFIFTYHKIVAKL